MKPETKTKIKNLFKIAPRRATFKTILGAYINLITIMFAFFSSGVVKLPILLGVSVVMLIPILTAYFSLPTNVESGKRVIGLAATMLESMKNVMKDETERRKLEMIIMLSVNEWDQINMLLEKASNGGVKKTPLTESDRIKNKPKEVEDNEEEEEIN